LGSGGTTGASASAAFFFGNMVLVAAVMTSADAARVMKAAAAFALEVEEVSSVCMMFCSWVPPNEKLIMCGQGIG
jgi:hypothetical protein